MAGKQSGDTEPISLPIEVQYTRAPIWEIVLFHGIIAALFGEFTWLWSMMKAATAVKFDTHLLLDPFHIFATFIIFTNFMQAVARRRLGPGTLTVTCTGFRDTRLSDMTIPWRAFDDARPWLVGKGRRLRGARLRIRPAAALPPLNEAYFKAYPAGKRHICIDFRTFKRRNGLAECIVGCVQSAQARYHPLATPS